MSYTVLARRYRSGTFDELIGQEHIVKTLKRAIESDRIAHAYLFCGTRGTGKTSMARILAKALNCQKSDRPTTEPCNECDSCKSIARGDDIDVIELDGASNRGIDEVRKIIENSRYRPARSRFKVYIIDEVHALTKDAFNALLKVLEEPAEHVKFILATTEPERVLPTILSRCQRYDFRNIPSREVVAHLLDICKQEKINADEDALLLIAKAGAGSMRDSLSLLDRLLSVGEKHLTIDMIEQLLGMPKAQVIFELVSAIGGGEVKSALQISAKLIAGGLSAESLVAALIDHLRNLLILRACGEQSDLVELPGFSPAELMQQADLFDMAALSQDVAILEELRRSLRTSMAGRALFDATLVRLALADQFTNVGALLRGEMPNGSATPAQKKKPELTSGNAASLMPSPAAVKPSADVASSNVSEDEDDDLPAPGKVWDDSGPSLSEMMKAYENTSKADAKSSEDTPSPRPSPERRGSDAEATIANVEPVDASDLEAVMSKLRTAIHSKSPGIDGFLVRGKFSGIDSSGIAIIRYPANDSAAIAMLDRNGKKQIIQNELSALLNKSVGVKFEIDPDQIAVPATPVIEAAAHRAESRRTEITASPPPANTPASPMIRITPELKAQLRESEPLIKALMDDFGAEIVKVE